MQEHHLPSNLSSLSSSSLLSRFLSDDESYNSNLKSERNTNHRRYQKHPQGSWIDNELEDFMKDFMNK